MTDIDREAAARAATPGPWASDDGGNVFDPSVSPMHDDPRLALSSAADARHIAANDPATILTDIERMRGLKAENERLTDARAIVTEYVREQCADCGYQVCDDDSADVACAVASLIAALKEATDE